MSDNENSERTDAGRILENLKYGWKFTREEIDDPIGLHVDESRFEDVRVPHDWAIYGPFDEENDVQNLAVLADGVPDIRRHVGRTAGLPVAGVGWYRRALGIKEEYKDKRVFLDFDGVMSNSSVYVNGKLMGTRPYGYSSFSYDITEAVDFGGENVVAVKAAPEPCASRWYPGAGIYRPVYLVVKEPVHIKKWGNYITTSYINDLSAQIHIRTQIQGIDGEYTYKVALFDENGERSASEEKTVDKSEAQAQIQIKNPNLWSVHRPYLYTAQIDLLKDGEVLDSVCEKIGIRTIAFDNKKGFFLNGKQTKLNGVCLHHDSGALGTAVSYRAIQRKLEILKKMGCNAIRTSHNPPSNELLDLCDRLGFMVLDEAFDEWRYKKVDNGYQKHFEEWAEKDLTDMMLRDRNHPSIIMWSIGNEILDQKYPDGKDTARWLTSICHEVDPTRPVTAAFDLPYEAEANGLMGEVDIPGMNYKPFLYRRFHIRHPEWILYGSETASCVSSRGKYYFPAEVEQPVAIRDDLYLSSYDLASPKWATLPEEEFEMQDRHEYLLGEFVWTGFDYLGEPTPHRNNWPSRSSYFGIVDLCGIPKDRYYSYMAKWGSEDVLHVFPHWTHPGREGQKVPVHCYTNLDSAELFINGVSQGIAQKRWDNEVTRYRLIWNDAVYEPGEITVVASDKKGISLKRSICTAGPEAKVGLTPDRDVIKADGDDLSYITVNVLDEEGNLCPHSDTQFEVEVEGAGELLAVDNGDQTSTESFYQNKIRAFSGQCMLIVRSVKGVKGEIKVAVKSEHMDETVTLKTV